jgi:DNA sulfur modification protein DndD
MDIEKEIKNEFKELLELAPLAINGGLLKEIENQIEQERKATNSVVDKKELNSRIKQVINELAIDDGGVGITEPLAIREYFIGKVSDLLEHHLINHNHSDANIKILHDLNRDQSYNFAALMANLRTTYRGRLLAISSSLKMNKYELGDISRKLTNSESKESDLLIQNYREEKNQIDNALQTTQNELVDIGIAIGSIDKEIASKQLEYAALAGKIKVNEQYVSKDILADRLIKELDKFIKAMKLKKKTALEGRILNDLNSLMHKRGFISRVNVMLEDNSLDIQLIDKDGIEIMKEDLSKGEKQLYATAVLKSLVEESGIDFPVFIDSPLQKLDDKHAHTIIKYFYPGISKQVVLLALLNKELNKEE